ncbi:hypothetical protein GCM10011415_02670 [Salipiger pallidus]|uniref:Uncharacterized protein n=1 Tax=Salipiger pallidus TaxID=1775170 RepID=A0A8J2ZGD2_9RHOB|nr:hypothetical protein GCM10011415_02670 [Salipiger pallidus]
MKLPSPREPSPVRPAAPVGAASLLGYGEAVLNAKHAGHRTGDAVSECPLEFQRNRAVHFYDTAGHTNRDLLILEPAVCPKRTFYALGESGVGGGLATGDRHGGVRLHGLPHPVKTARAIRLCSL